MITIICIHIHSECTVLKKRKFVGALPEQTVRQKPKPFIIEVDQLVHTHVHIIIHVDTL